MLQALNGRGDHKQINGSDGTNAAQLKKVDGGDADPIRDQQDQRVTGTSRRGRIRQTIQTVSKRVNGAVAKGVAVALLLGAMVAPAMAQTTVNEGVPLRPVDVRVVQQQALGDNAPLLTQLRTGHTLADHQKRAAITYPFLGMMELPTESGEKMRIMSHEALWRLISVAAEEAEGAAELTSMIQTTPVAGELVWSPQVEGPDGKKVDVLPLLLPQVANPDGSVNMEKLKTLFLRVSNPAPSADAENVFNAENIGFQNGRVQYFSINSINPEPVQPHDAAGNLLLPQLTLEVNGHKTVYTIGSLSYKGGGPSFKPDGSGYSYGYSADRQKTPLNMTERKPIYSGNTYFGLFDYEPEAKTNENGWMLLDHGAYAGMSIMEFKLGELVDWQTDEGGRIVGEPGPISIEQLKKDGRIKKDLTPSLQWRAFETEYRLSSFKNPDEGVEVLQHMQQLFARDAVFDYIANDDGLSKRWAEATEKARGGDDTQMKKVWQDAMEGLNAVIARGDHHLKDKIELGDDGVATLTVDDYVRSAIQRSARSVAVLHKLDLNHGSIAAGGDNINAAWQMVDLDHLDAAHRNPADPKDHPNVREFTNNLEGMVDDLKDRVPEMQKYDGQMRDLLKQAIDREAPIYGKAAQPQNNG